MSEISSAGQRYRGDFSWKITDPVSVSKFLNASPGTKISSEIFIVGGLKWQLYAYPSGKYRMSRNTVNPIKGCELHLQLISDSWPKNTHKIIFNYRLFCANAFSSFTNIAQFVQNQDHNVNWYRGTLTTRELELLEGKIIHLQCYVNILKIIAMDQSSIIYQFPYKNDRNHIEFEWRVNNVHDLFLNTKCGKHLESKIYNNFWCLRVAPKGWKLKEQKHVALWLQLCGLPMNVSRIAVNYTLKCIETNTYYTKRNCVFGYNHYQTNSPWNNKNLWTNSLRNLHRNTLTFECKINIIKRFGINNDVMHGNNRREQQQQSYRNDDVKSSEIDGLKQEISRLNVKVNAMEQTIKRLQLRMGIGNGDDTEEKGAGDTLNIMEILKETKKEIELLKTEKNKDIGDKYDAVKVWLTDVVALPEYYSLFIKNGFDDMAVVKMLSREELRALGIQKRGHQLRLLSAIQELRNADDTMDVEGHAHVYPTPNDHQ